MNKIEISSFQETQTQEIIDLILNIQQNEFQVPITLEDQPDLLKIEEYYKTGKGNFWVALHEGKVVGTIALIDCGEHIGCIRKMFVKSEYRGKERGLAQGLLHELQQFAAQHHFKSLYLGTNGRLHAAIRFYERNGFYRVDVGTLPSVFPRMEVDTHFFRKDI